MSFITSDITAHKIFVVTSTKLFTLPFELSAHWFVSLLYALASQALPSHRCLNGNLALSWGLGKDRGTEGEGRREHPPCRSRQLFSAWLTVVSKYFKNELLILSHKIETKQKSLIPLKRNHVIQFSNRTFRMYFSLENIIINRTDVIGLFRALNELITLECWDLNLACNKYPINATWNFPQLPLISIISPSPVTLFALSLWPLSHSRILDLIYLQQEGLHLWNLNFKCLILLP